MTPENAARQFLAALPEGCEPDKQDTYRGNQALIWGNQSRGPWLAVTIFPDGLVNVAGSKQVNGKPEHYELFRWTGTIPPPLLARIEEFATKGKMR